MSNDTSSVGSGGSDVGGASGPSGPGSTGGGDDTNGAGAAAEAAANDTPDSSANDVGNDIAGGDGVDASSDAQAADEAAAIAETVAENEAQQKAADEAAVIAETVAENEAQQAAAEEAAAAAQAGAQAAETTRGIEVGQMDEASIAAIAQDLGVKADDLQALVDDAKKADAAAAEAPPAEAPSHTVVAGDTLGAIAGAHGVSLSDVLAANPSITDADRIEVGQEIALPDGAQKTDVAAAQSALAAQGFAPGPIDGIAGPRTEAAVRSFQRANGLNATGQLDAATAKALASAPAPAAAPTGAVEVAAGGPLGALLDRIAFGEGTSQAAAAKHGFKSGYDVTLGYGAFTPSAFKGKNLTDLTLGEVKQLQAGMLSHPKNRFDSSAVGRYQIVGKTLRGLQSQMGIPDSARFTPQLQDRMAAKLVEGRGLRSFQSGRISATTFQNRLAKEWASIANSRTGQSHYGQRTGTSSSQIQAVLAGLRS